MADLEEQDKSTATAAQEPRGFGEHTRGLSGEYAHEQGWQLNEDERRKQTEGKHDTDGGTDYEYGAQDFGDEPVNTAGAATDDDVAKAREALLGDKL